jgi:hypothetical protein
MDASSRAEMLPNNLISRLPMQDLNGQGFRGLLSRMALTQSPGWQRLEGGTTKETSRERQKEHARSRSGRSPDIAI